MSWWRWTLAPDPPEPRREPPRVARTRDQRLAQERLHELRKRLVHIEAQVATRHTPEGDDE